MEIYIDVGTLKKENYLPHNFWFFEDYYRYKP